MNKVGRQKKLSSYGYFETNFKTGFLKRILNSFENFKFNIPLFLRDISKPSFFETVF